MRGEGHRQDRSGEEALTGATVAALTVYDMLKSISHGIVIKEARLVRKTGGKSDYADESARLKHRFPAWCWLEA